METDDRRSEAAGRVYVGTRRRVTLCGGPLQYRIGSMLILAASLALFVYGVTAAMLGTLMPTFHLTDAQNGSVALP